MLLIENMNYPLNFIESLSITLKHDIELPFLFDLRPDRLTKQLS